MCIEHLKVTNILGVRSLSTDLHRMVLVCGGNGAGKSSLLQAIRFGITGDYPDRVKLKKDAAALVSDGAKSGSVELTYADWIGDDVIHRTLPEKDRMQPPSIFQTAAARCGLDAHLFGRLGATERRQLLAEVVGTGDPSAWAGERLRAEGVPSDIADELVATLRGGWDAAAKYAGEQASQQRGAWKAITGEVYGSKKAGDWKRQAPPKPEGDIDDMEAQRVSLESDLQEVTEQIGTARARAEAPSEERIVNLREKIEEGAHRLQGFRESLKQAEADAKAGQGVTAPCPCCQAMLVIDGIDLKVAPENAEPAPQAFARAKELRAKVGEAEQWLATKRGELQTLEQLRAAVTDVAADLPSIDELEARRTEIRQDLDVLGKRVQALREHSHAVKRADDDTERAMNAHLAAVAWSHVADLLKPDGLPAELLAKQLAPIRERLALPGAAVTLGDDMELRLDGRAYALLSESEQWRVDVAISLAVCRAGNIPLLLIDRFDVIEPAGRMQILNWLAQASANLQVIVAATLKAAPSLPIAQTIWLGNDSSATAKAA